MSDAGKGYLLPLRRDPVTGALEWAVPGLVDDMMGAAALPGEVYQGQVDPMSPVGMERGFGLAGMAATGPIGRGAGALSAPKTMASRSTNIYNPPAKSARPIEADYPRGVPVDDAGRITHDIEGRPLGAQYVVGRRQVGDVLGGRDQALSPEAGDYVSITEAAIGSRPQDVAAGALPRGSVGVFRDGRGVDGPERSIGVLDSLPADVGAKVTAHEVGHMVDVLSSGIDARGLSAELKVIYNDLNNPDLANARAHYGPGVDPASRSVYRAYGPQNQGYAGADVPRESMAEAIRAYMADPNYIKTVAPKTAAAIRAAVNANPRLMDTIQFNQGSPVLAAGTAAMQQGETGMSLDQQRALALARARRRRAEAQGRGGTSDGSGGRAFFGENSTRPRTGAGRAGALGAVDTATFGFGDEAASGLAYLLDKLPGERGRSYDELLATARGAQSRAREDAPGAYLTGQIAGGVGSGVGLARAGLSAGANAARAGQGLGRVALGSARDGAIMGALQGAGSGEGVEGRAMGAVVGGGGGWALGGAAPYAGAVAGAGFRALSAPVMARLRPEPYAAQAMAEGLRRSGMTPDEVAARIAAARADGQDMFTVADAMGHSGQRMLSTVARTPNDARQGVVDALQARQTGQGERLAATLSEGFGAADTAAQRAAFLTARRSADASRNYGAARGGAVPVDPSAAIREADAFLRPGASGLMNPGTNIADDSVEAAVRRARSYLTDGRSRISDFDVGLRAKQEMDAMIERAQPTVRRQLIPIRNALDDALSNASRDYAQARNVFRRQSREIDAVGAGTAAASGRRRAADTVPEFQGMTAGEQEAFRAGYADPMIARVESSSISPTTNKARTLLTEKTGQEFPVFAAPGRGDRMGNRIAREQRMFETANAALGGSRTADNLADAAEMNRFDPAVMTALFQGRPDQAVIQAVTRLLGEARGMPPRVVESIARTLMETRPDAVRAILSQAMQAGAQRNGRRALANTILTALGASGAGRLAAP